MLLTKALTLFLSISKCTLTAAEQGNSSSEQDDQSGSVSVERHNAEIISQLAEKPVQGVRKMTDDEGEKFFLDYWRFVDNAQGISLSGREAGDHNATMGDAESDAAQNQNKFDEELPAVFLARTYPFRPSFLSSGSDANLEGSWESSNSNSNSNSLQPRNFKCPTGTYGCTSINRPNRCCRAGETCELVSDTGSGDVGCCPSGETCSGIVGYCQAGYTACSDTLGGGCCIPGYDCVPGGCECIDFILARGIAIFYMQPILCTDTLTRCVYRDSDCDCALDGNDIDKNRVDRATGISLFLFFIHNQIKWELSTTSTTYESHNCDHSYQQPEQRLNLPNRILRLLSSIPRRMLPHRAKLRHDLMPNDIVNDTHLGREDDRRPCRNIWVCSWEWPVRQWLVQLCRHGGRRVLSDWICLWG